MVLQVLYWMGILLVAYIIVSSVIHYLIAPLKFPDLEHYFKEGDTFRSDAEGIQQTILRIEDGMVYGELRMDARAPGPPMHFHMNFDEAGRVEDGELTAVIEGEKKILRQGESIEIPKGKKHTFYNHSNEPVVIRADEQGIPLGFMYCLSQFYGLFDKDASNMKMPKILLYISLYGNHFDTWPADAPEPVVRFINFILAPTARLLGYKNYYEEFDPKHNRKPAGPVVLGKIEV
ncbi:MAG TPA: cupin domain-containing protein [Flavipsychrobacter sp.]|nr:cupin domain-containing protein [Flavipsychrobacter sp.]